MDAVFRGQVT